LIPRASNPESIELMWLSLVANQVDPKLYLGDVRGIWREPATNGAKFYVANSGTGTVNFVEVFDSGLSVRASFLASDPHKSLWFFHFIVF
jgi:ABC-type Na+ efflux pump permease subunit